MGFFKAYDMRGVFGADFGLDTVYRVGLALPGAVSGGRWLVGRDCRTTGGAVARALCDGLRDAGAHVDFIGLCTTPMVYAFTAMDGYDASAMVTASHNPPGDNGIKVSRRDAVPVGYADGLRDVEAAIASSSAVYRAREGGPGEGDAPRPAFVRRYVSLLHSLAGGPERFSNLRFAVDCSCGMASLVAAGLFPGAVILNGAMDGSFPAHSPNPLSPEAWRQAADAVKAGSLDCAVVFDGDADRAVFVDENGAFVRPDLLIEAAASECPGFGPGAKVLHDVRTSRGTVELLREEGCEPVMVSVGHVFAKKAMRETGAVCGGELAGHYYFRDFFNCDGGALAAMRILAAAAKAKKAGMAFSRFAARAGARYANTGELNFRVEDKDAAVRRVLAAAAAAFPRETARSTIDGIRVEYDAGWFNIRKSNTEPYLRAVVECDTPERLALWRETITRAVEAGGDVKEGKGL